MEEDCYCTAICNKLISNCYGKQGGSHNLQVFKVVVLNFPFADK